MIDSNQNLKRCFSAPPMIAYRRGKNLRDHIIKAKSQAKEGQVEEKMALNHVVKVASPVGCSKHQKPTPIQELNRAGQSILQSTAIQPTVFIKVAAAKGVVKSGQP